MVEILRAGWFDVKRVDLEPLDIEVLALLSFRL